MHARLLQKALLKHFDRNSNALSVTETAAAREMSLQQVDKRAEDALAAATGPDVKAALTTEESEVQSPCIRGTS